MTRGLGLFGKSTTEEERRALALGAASSLNYAVLAVAKGVPFVLMHWCPL
jgi:hypothetical protein